MKTAKAVAEQLAAHFLENGNYSFANPMKAEALSKLLPAAAGGQEFEQFEDYGFAGLAVQSVGYEEGAEQPKVHIYVTKGSRKALQSAIEGVQKGVEIEVNRMGKLIVRPDQASGATNQGNVFVHKSRVACGSSCAPSGENYAGTFGTLVQKGNTKQLFVLSNNHVLAACNHVPVGMPILAPSSQDGRPGVRAPGEIARHEAIVELRSGEPTLVSPCREDVALAKVTDPNLVSSWQGTGTQGYDTPHAVAVPGSGMAVKKTGRTSGLTGGTVEALINTPTPIPYKAKFFSATVWLRDVWTVRGDSGMPFALPGDSGSLVVTEDAKTALGLVFAAQGEYGWMIPMAHIVTLFGGLRLVSGHGV